jgi:biotin-(acetyl-CoA carboxylase) ligase
LLGLIAGWRLKSGGDSMPGFDTLGARLARSRRKLERERAATQDAGRGRDGNDMVVPGQGGAAAASVAMPAPAQVIRFPRLNQRFEN